MINLKQVLTIQTIVSEGSITAASKKLFVSQPALSQLVKSVENELGVPLFERSHNRLRLTRAGELYLEAAQSIQMISNNLIAQIQDTKNTVFGEVCLGISTQRGLQLLPYVVPRFVEAHPHVRLSLVEEGSGILEQMLLQGQCDIAFITTTKKSNRLNYALIQNEKLVLIADKTTSLAQRFPDGATIDIAQARHEKFVCMNNDHSVRIVQNRLFEENDIRPHIILETHNMEAAKAVTARAGAVFLVPDVYVAHMPDRDRIHVYSIANVNYERHFYFCYPKGMYLNRYQKEIVRIVCDHLHAPYML